MPTITRLPPADVQQIVEAANGWFLANSVFQEFKTELAGRDLQAAEERLTAACQAVVNRDSPRPR